MQQFGAPGTYQYQSLTNLGVIERDSLGIEKVPSTQPRLAQGSGQQSRSNGTGGKQSRKSIKLPSSGKGVGPEQHSLVFKQYRDSRSHVDPANIDSAS